MVDGTALEMRHTCKGIVGSNPTLSATSRGYLRLGLASAKGGIHSVGNVRFSDPKQTFIPPDQLKMSCCWCKRRPNGSPKRDLTLINPEAEFSSLMLDPE